jgi:hypothetical protein
MSVEMINKACKYYPCHKNLQSCVFCYCPFYACGNKRRGKYLVVKNEDGITKLVWDCSKCTWIHKKATVDKIFKEVNKIFYSIKKDK